MANIERIRAPHLIKINDTVENLERTYFTKARFSGLERDIPFPGEGKVSSWDMTFALASGVHLSSDQQLVYGTRATPGIRIVRMRARTSRDWETVFQRVVLQDNKIYRLGSPLAELTINFSQQTMSLHQGALRVINNRQEMESELQSLQMHLQTHHHLIDASFRDTSGVLYTRDQ